MVLKFRLVEDPLQVARSFFHGLLFRNVHFFQMFSTDLLRCKVTFKSFGECFDMDLVTITLCCTHPSAMWLSWGFFHFQVKASEAERIALKEKFTKIIASKNIRKLIETGKQPTRVDR